MFDFGVSKLLGAGLILAVLATGIQTINVLRERSAHQDTVQKYEQKIKEAELKGYQAALAKSEANRETERIANAANVKVIDDLRARQARLATALDFTNRRMRDAEAKYRAAASEADLAAATTCRGLDAPAVAIIPDETRESLVGIAQEADEVSGRLLACQQYVREVIVPTIPEEQ